MCGKDMSDSPFIIAQLEEALEERQCSDRRKSDEGSNPKTGVDRRHGDRRDTEAEK